VVMVEKMSACLFICTSFFIIVLTVFYISFLLFLFCAIFMLFVFLLFLFVYVYMELCGVSQING